MSDAELGAIDARRRVIVDQMNKKALDVRERANQELFRLAKEEQGILSNPALTWDQRTDIQTGYKQKRDAIEVQIIKDLNAIHAGDPLHA